MSVKGECEKANSGILKWMTLTRAGVSQRGQVVSDFAWKLRGIRSTNDGLGPATLQIPPPEWCVWKLCENPRVRFKRHFIKMHYLKISLCICLSETNDTWMPRQLKAATKDGAQRQTSGQQSAMCWGLARRWLIPQFNANAFSGGITPVTPLVRWSPDMAGSVLSTSLCSSLSIQNLLIPEVGADPLHQISAYYTLAVYLLKMKKKSNIRQAEQIGYQFPPHVKLSAQWPVHSSEVTGGFAVTQPPELSPQNCVTAVSVCPKGSPTVLHLNDALSLCYI